MGPYGEVAVLAEAGDIRELVELDQRLFGQHHALSVEEAARMHAHGALLAIRDAGGRMVAEAQVVTTPIPGAVESLLRALPSGCGYFAGVAVDPAHRGRGLAIALSRAIDKLLRDAGADSSWATVRAENLASLRNLTEEGYVVVGYAPRYYPGDGLGSARLVLLKILAGASSPARSGATAALARLNPQADRSVLIPVDGEHADAAAHAQIKAVLANGFIGVGVERLDSGGRMIFEKPDEVGDKLLLTRRDEAAEHIHKC